jgi:hypothetical protein
VAAPKLAADSTLDLDDQERLYREAMGAERAARQVEARRRELGRCVCQPSKVRKRWSGEDAPRLRTVHGPTCPKWQAWMSS